jgi:hypothetical protein
MEKKGCFSSRDHCLIGSFSRVSFLIWSIFERQAKFSNEAADCHNGLMKYFRKTGKVSNVDAAKIAHPENTKLFQLIEDYIKDNAYDNYKKVVTELTEGNALLVLPAERDDDTMPDTGVSSRKDSKIIIGIYFVDGLKATAAFTSKEALFYWAKRATKCISLPSKTVIEICEANDIDRIVIDSKLRTMIVLQRNDK